MAGSAKESLGGEDSPTKRGGPQSSVRIHRRRRVADEPVAEPDGAAGAGVGDRRNTTRRWLSQIPFVGRFFGDEPVTPQVSSPSTNVVEPHADASELEVLGESEREALAVQSSVVRIISEPDIDCTQNLQSPLGIFDMMRDWKTQSNGKYGSLSTYSAPIGRIPSDLHSVLPGDMVSNVHFRTLFEFLCEFDRFRTVFLSADEFQTQMLHHLFIDDPHVMKALFEIELTLKSLQGEGNFHQNLDRQFARIRRSLQPDDNGNHSDRRAFDQRSPGMKARINRRLDISADLYSDILSMDVRYKHLGLRRNIMLYLLQMALYARLLHEYRDGGPVCLQSGSLERGADTRYVFFTQNASIGEVTAVNGEFFLRYQWISDRDISVFSEQSSQGSGGLYEVAECRVLGMVTRNDARSMGETGYVNLGEDHEIFRCMKHEISFSTDGSPCLVIVDRVNGKDVARVFWTSPVRMLFRAQQTNKGDSKVLLDLTDQFDAMTSQVIHTPDLSHSEQVRKMMSVSGM